MPAGCSSIALSIEPAPWVLSADTAAVGRQNVVNMVMLLKNSDKYFFDAKLINSVA
jgi:hypothetical protein